MTEYECPECGKVLKTAGGLNGHRAFSHGVKLQRGMTVDELRLGYKALNVSIDAINKRLGELVYPCEVCGEDIPLTKVELSSVLKDWHHGKCHEKKKGK